MPGTGAVKSVCVLGLVVGRSVLYGVFGGGLLPVSDSDKYVCVLCLVVGSNICYEGC